MDPDLFSPIGSSQFCDSQTPKGQGGMPPWDVQALGSEGDGGGGGEGGVVALDNLGLSGSLEREAL